MDICSGHGGVSRSVRRFGFQSKFWDVRHGEAHDITNPYVLGRIISEIKKGRVLSCMLSPPCIRYAEGVCPHSESYDQNKLVSLTIQSAFSIRKSTRL